MKKIKFWIWKCFHRKTVKCRHFCGFCEFCEACMVDMENEREVMTHDSGDWFYR